MNGSIRHAESQFSFPPVVRQSQITLAFRPDLHGCMGATELPMQVLLVAVELKISRTASSSDRCRKSGHPSRTGIVPVSPVHWRPVVHEGALQRTPALCI